MSESRKGENNPNYGKTITDEVRRTQSEARKLWWERKKQQQQNEENL